MHVAALSSNAKLTQGLAVAHGADVDTHDADGSSPRDVARARLGTPTSSGKRDAVKASFVRITPVAQQQQQPRQARASVEGAVQYSDSHAIGTSMMVGPSAQVWSSLHLNIDRTSLFN